MADLTSQLMMMSPDGFSSMNAALSLAAESTGANNFDPPDISRKQGKANVLMFRGPLFATHGFFTQMLNLWSTEDYMEEFARLESKGAPIFMDIRGPGGQTEHMFELFDMISESKVPVSTYVGSTAASAHFLIAMAARGERIVHPAAEVGSMGVVAITGGGPREYEIVSSNAINKRPGRDEIQKRIDSMESSMVQRVASHAGMSASETIEAANQGGLITGATAVEAGLFHSTGNKRSALAASKVATIRPIKTIQPTNEEEDSSMGDLTKTEAAKQTADAITANNERWAKLQAHPNSSNVRAMTRLATNMKLSTEEALEMMDDVKVEAAAGGEAAPAAPAAPAAGTVSKEALTAAIGDGVIAALKEFKIDASDTQDIPGSNDGDNSSTSSSETTETAAELAKRQYDEGRNLV